MSSSTPGHPLNGGEQQTSMPAKRSNRLSKRFKRLSTPAKPSNPVVSQTNTNPSRFSIAALSMRSISNSSTPSTATSSSRVTSSRSSVHSGISSATSKTSAPSAQDSQILIKSDCSFPSYDPLKHYVPCMHSTCSAHYQASALGLTFYSRQTPYNLRRKRGFCPSHASADLNRANAECKKAYERMRQNAGRKTLGDVAAEYDVFVQTFHAERESESKGFASEQKVMIIGGGEFSLEWDWRYMPRPCTKKDCEAEWYSPFSQELYKSYSAPRKSNLTLLPTLCPNCAREDAETVEAEMKAKREELDDEEWIMWLEKLRKGRKIERDFWEEAQERVVRERGMSIIEIEIEGEKEKAEEHVQKKGLDVTRDMCAVM